MIHKIARIPIKQVWQYEDKHLTPWLCDNIDVISDAIGVPLVNAEREQSTGNFSVDIKAEDENGDNVVIENQFGSSDHDHLGKLITYLTSFKAKTAIWIVEVPKQEHINAVNWLNETDNNVDFYLLQLEAIKIGESNPAPLLTKIAGPSEESKKLGKLKKEDSERHKLRLEFWTQVLEATRKIEIKAFNSISPNKDAWIAATSGTRGLSYVFWVNQHSVRIELRIDRGKGSEEENLEILEKLKNQKDQIENTFGEDLNWADLEGYRVCSIRKDYTKGGYRNNPKEWTEIIEEAVSNMKKLIEILSPIIRTLRLR
jgi:hypothetical protein